MSGRILLLLLAIVGGVSCTQTEVVTGDSIDSAPAEVSFSVSTVADPLPTRAGAMGFISSTDMLKGADYGFGVFAFYTDVNVWDYFDGTSGKELLPPNFMYNQSVEWTDVEGEEGAWLYNPVKYWPNNNTPADDEGATGSQEHSYVSFFAYAPYVAEASLVGTETGIYALSGNAEVGSPFLCYRLDTKGGNLLKTGEEQVDLLWGLRGKYTYQEADGTDNTIPTLGNAYNTDLTKQTVNEQVKFLFKHALSRFTITVQGLFDHINNEDESPNYPIDVNENTKILIESVDFDGSPLFKEGTLYIAPRVGSTDVPEWDVTGSANLNMMVEGTDINPEMSDTYEVEGGGATETYHSDALIDRTDAADALTDFEALPTGVTHTERSLFISEDTYYLVIPNKGQVTTDTPMKIRMVYYVITYDPQLKLNTPKYYSIVKNDVTATFSTAFAFEANKSYKLRLQPGLTTVKFEVEEIDEWGRSVLLDAVVKDWVVETHEYNVE